MFSFFTHRLAFRLKHYILFPEDDDFWVMFLTTYSGVYENSRLAEWYVDVDMNSGMSGELHVSALIVLADRSDLNSAHTLNENKATFVRYLRVCRRSIPVCKYYWAKSPPAPSPSIVSSSFASF